jgi:hypothetical protein
VRLGEDGARLAAFEQQRVPLVVVRIEPHGAVALPALERVGLLLGLPVGPVQLENGWSAVRALGAQDVSGRARLVGLAQL